MAATVTKVGRSVPGANFIYDFDFTCDASYPTGGYDVSAPVWGLNIVKFIFPMCLTAGMAAGVSDMVYDRTNRKLKFFTSGGVEVAAATNLSTVKAMVQIYGS